MAAGRESFALFAPPPIAERATYSITRQTDTQTLLISHVCPILWVLLLPRFLQQQQKKPRRKKSQQQQSNVSDGAAAGRSNS